MYLDDLWRSVKQWLCGLTGHTLESRPRGCDNIEFGCGQCSALWTQTEAMDRFGQEAVDRVDKKFRGYDEEK